jgi:hypothetical protein
MFEQTDQREFVHRVDPDGRICYVNDNWLAFAAENEWPVAASDVVGTRLVDAISDPETQHLYQLLQQRVRAGGGPVQFQYRCDAPDCRRLLRMEMRYEKDWGALEFRSRVLLIERREPVRLLRADRATRGSSPLPICGWCKAVWVGSGWLEVEQAVLRLRLFADDALPRLSHGICPTCSERLTALAEA